ncbi:MAG: serine hydrolase [Blautia sp.]|nr:serine hydrolase [Blautia sp.]
MNLAKRLIRISAVTAATVLMYEGALSLDRTTEANASLQADASPNTQKKAPETESDTIIKETTAETETEKTEKTSTKTKAPVKTAASAKSKTPEETEATTETAVPSETEASTKSNAPAETKASTENKAPKKTEDSTEDKAPAETEDSTETQTPGVTPEEESELASEGIRTESPASESSDPDTKYYLTSQYLLVPSFKNLKKDLNEMIDTYEGSWSIYVKDLKSGISLTINDQPQDSASLIKLYIAGAVLEKIQHQELEETETIDLLLSDMISLSDNEAANELVRYLSDSHEHQDGMEKVNEFIEEHDFTDTWQYNGLEDSNLWYGDEVNITSVKDCGRFLEEIYDGDMVSHLASRQLEGYLLDQEITWKIPAGIPSEIKTANKTGEKDNTQNDASIVYTPYRDYIICVMATNLTDEDTAVENIRAVSAKVYGFFQEADAVTAEKTAETEETDNTDRETESNEASEESDAGTEAAEKDPDFDS